MNFLKLTDVDRRDGLVRQSKSRGQCCRRAVTLARGVAWSWPCPQMAEAEWTAVAAADGLHVRRRRQGEKRGWNVRGYGAA